MERFQPLRYDIRVAGHLDASHAEWLGDLHLQPTFHQNQAITVLSGILADQAAVYEVLNKLQAMGVVLLEVTRILP